MRLGLAIVIAALGVSGLIGCSSASKDDEMVNAPRVVPADQSGAPPGVAPVSDAAPGGGGGGPAQASPNEGG